jgi:chromosome segregation ATPase
MWAERAQVQRSNVAVPAIQKQNDELKSEIAVLRSQVTELEKAGKDLNLRLFKLEMARNQYKSIELDLSSRGFQRLDNDSDTASFLVSVEDATPYLDG